MSCLTIKKIESMEKLFLFLSLYSFTFLFSQSEIKNVNIQSEFLKLLNDYRVSEKLNTVVLILSINQYNSSTIENCCNEIISIINNSIN